MSIETRPLEDPEQRRLAGPLPLPPEAFEVGQDVAADHLGARGP